MSLRNNPTAFTLMPSMCASRCFWLRPHERPARENVHVAVAVKVADRQTAAAFPVEARDRGDLLELAVRFLAVEPQVLPVGVVARADQDVQPAVVVHVEEGSVEIAEVPALGRAKRARGGRARAP